MLWLTLCAAALAARAAAGDVVVYPDAAIAGLNWVEVPAGSFQMGTGDHGNQDQTGPEHEVEITAFNMSQTHVTNAMYVQFLNKLWGEGRITVETVDDSLCGLVDAVVAGPDEYYFGQQYLLLGGFSVDEGPENVCYIEFDADADAFQVKASADGYDVANWPVVFVRWYGAYAMAREYGYWLPLDAQWEYAARAGNYSNTYPTATGALTEAEANWAGNVGHPTPVCSYPKTPWGFCDLAGNAWSWTHDWWCDARTNDCDPTNYYTYSAGFQDPVGINGTEEAAEDEDAAEGGPNSAYNFDAHTVRGCSYNYHSATCEIVYHRWDYPARGNDHFSMRLVDMGPDYWRYTTPPPEGTYVEEDDDSDGGGNTAFAFLAVILVSAGLFAAYKLHQRSQRQQARGFAVLGQADLGEEGEPPEEGYSIATADSAPVPGRAWRTAHGKARTQPGPQSVELQSVPP